jgi:hypothetical protein
MRSRAVPAAILAALVSCPAALPGSGSGKSRTIRFTAGTVAVRAVVPEVFEPLLPGSIYPNRRKAKPWRAGPVAIVEKSLASRAEGDLLSRGFLVAEVESIDAATVDAIAAGLARKIEGGIGAVTLVARRPGSALSNPTLRSAALFDPPEWRPAPSSSGCLPVTLFHRAASGEVPAPAPLADGGCVVEKWYRSDADFPDEAFRDAAEWLAAASRPRDGLAPGSR